MSQVGAESFLQLRTTSAMGLIIDAVEATPIDMYSKKKSTHRPRCYLHRKSSFRGSLLALNISGPGQWAAGALPDSKRWTMLRAEQGQKRVDMGHLANAMNGHASHGTGLYRWAQLDVLHGKSEFLKRPDNHENSDQSISLVCPLRVQVAGQSCCVCLIVSPNRHLQSPVPLRRVFPGLILTFCQKVRAASRNIS